MQMCVNQQALKSCTDVLGERHFDTAAALLNVGAGMSGLGIKEDALRVQMQALQGAQEDTVQE
jgi:hypothetical protein